MFEVSGFTVALIFMLGFVMGLNFRDSMEFVVSRLKYIHDQSKRQGQ